MGSQKSALHGHPPAPSPPADGPHHRRLTRVSTLLYTSAIHLNMYAKHPSHSTTITRSARICLAFLSAHYVLRFCWRQAGMAPGPHGVEDWKVCYPSTRQPKCDEIDWNVCFDERLCVTPPATRRARALSADHQTWRPRIHRLS